MKKLVFTCIIASTFLFTGCINILEELFLKKDGTGQYVLTIDMSALMSSDMRSMLEGMAKEEGAELGGEERAPIEQDTLVKLADIPADMRGNISRPDFYEKVSMKINASESKEVMIMSFILDFDDTDDIDYFLKNMDQLFQNADTGSEGPMPNAMGGDKGIGGLIPSAGADYKVFDISSKMLQRFKAPKPDPNAEEDESMAMMKMMLADATYKTVYHLPGKVKSVSNTNAVQEGKTVTITSDLIDVLNGEDKLDTVIKFKKK